MFKIDGKNIKLTRGDIAAIEIGITNEIDGSDYEFQAGDIVRFKVFKRKDCGCVELVKDVKVENPSTTVEIQLTSKDTKIGGIIDKSVDYWYEVELNPDTAPQTIIGVDYDEELGKDVPAIFKLLPESGDDE